MRVLCSFLTAVVCCSAGAARAQDDLRTLQQQALRAAVDHVAPSVVRIETFGGLERVGQLLVSTGPTTGLIVDADGYILSSAINFVQLPSSILVTLPDGSRAAAKIVARDRSRMLVLLKVETDTPLPVPEVAPRDTMRPGQWTVAVGRTFFGASPNVSIGVLSATHRIWSRAVQTDAKVSPANYGGPLVDVHGRVLGILVPLSPKGQDNEIAGAEWYDSGIGFAAVLADVMDRLETLKQGHDLVPGLLGVSLARGDANADPAVVATARPRSPAAEAGIEPEDKIVEINGAAIARQNQLKHALGPLYAGDEVKLVVLRGETRRELSLTLTDKVEPFAHPLLGVLPLRDVDQPAGVGVRFVYADSPAAEAGIAPGDRITRLNGQEVIDAATLQEQIVAFEPDAEVVVGLQRNGEDIEVTCRLATLPEEVPASLPPALAAPPEPADEQQHALLDVKLPEEPNACAVLIPADYHDDVPHGLVIYLATPGKFERERLVEQWRQRCKRFDLLMLIVEPSDAKAWQPTETDVVRKAADQLLSTYNVDRTRVVTLGRNSGGAMAWMVAFAHRDLVHGVAAVDAVWPQRSAPPMSDPVQRLAFFLPRAEKSRLTQRLDAAVELLRKERFPVTRPDLGEQPRPLNDDELELLGRWIDTLDQI